MEDGNRFEEVDDAFLEDWADIGEIKEERDCTFAKMYGPIRALFATDSIVLSKFEDCLDHMERLSFLLNMEVSWLKGADNVVPQCICFSKYPATKITFLIIYTFMNNCNVSFQFCICRK